MAEEIIVREIENEDAGELGKPIEADGFFGRIAKQVSEDGYFASFPVETMAQKKRLYSATGASNLLRQYLDTPIELADIVFAPTTVSDETGEARSVMGVFLIDAEGESYVSSSVGVIKSAASILAQFGEPSTWDEPLVVVCKETTTSKGRRFKFLDVE